MTLVVDASVATKWYVDEQGSSEARAISAAEYPIAPDLIVPEVLNAIWKNVRLKRSTVEQLKFAAEALPRHLAAIVPCQLLAERASEFALMLDHPVYDCFYIALAEREKCPLVTADQRLYRSIKGTKFAKSVRPLLKTIT
ncbi:MAG TPA: type II toxin-antitoxin system VapC family toxin [Rhizomicrobium sp.]|nr:type II toxin-antitoxin system VapC family toxin [Rhizomicrobium sp.]